MLNILRLTIVLIAVCVMIGFTGKVLSETDVPRSLEAVKTSHPPNIDGMLDDPCWQEAPRATDFVDKFFDKVVDDQTIAYLLYDDENIYVAFYCYDSRPDRIIARETNLIGYF